MSGVGKQIRRGHTSQRSLTGPVLKATGLVAAGLHWAFGDAGPTDSANESIRRHIIAGSVLVEYRRSALAAGPRPPRSPAR